MKKKPKKSLVKVKHTESQNKDSDNSNNVKEYIHTVETIVIHNCKIIPHK